MRPTHMPLHEAPGCRKTGAKAWSACCGRASAAAPAPNTRRSARRRSTCWSCSTRGWTTPFSCMAPRTHLRPGRDLMGGAAAPTGRAPPDGDREQPARLCRVRRPALPEPAEPGMAGARDPNRDRLGGRWPGRGQVRPTSRPISATSPSAPVKNAVPMPSSRAGGRLACVSSTNRHASGGRPIFDAVSS